MKKRIAIWAGTGFLVALFWAFYVLVTAPHTSERMHNVWVLAGVSCPIIFARSHPVSVYQVLVANAATYALIGLVAEVFRRDGTPKPIV